MKQKIRRKLIFGVVASVVVLVVLEAIAYAIVNLIIALDSSQQAPFLYWIGGFSILLAFGFGLIIRSGTRTWDTWLDDLGPTQIAVLVEMLVKRQAHLEEEEE
jgi:hypothetical protein